MSPFCGKFTSSNSALLVMKNELFLQLVFFNDFIQERTIFKGLSDQAPKGQTEVSSLTTLHRNEHLRSAVDIKVLILLHPQKVLNRPKLQRARQRHPALPNSTNKWVSEAP